MAHVTGTPHLSFDNAPRLVGQLESNGLATLEVDTSALSSKSTKPPRSMKAALDAVAKVDYSDTTSTASEEDYDNLKLDPLTVVAGGKGGGFDGRGSEMSPVIDEKVYQELTTAPQSQESRPRAHRMQSISITLKKSGQKGKYFLLADEKELKGILTMGAAREKQNTSTKRRTKFSDILFTRQFTAFDRQNTDSAASPFHGFFNLFWLGTAIFMIQTAARNYAAHGNIMGSNEILQMMVRRDLVVLGLSDGVLCGITGFSWLLQKVIGKGWISWNGQGWIIQSVWETLYIGAVVYWTLFRDWVWQHTVFFVLHGIVMLMKQHSYAFYNGYLSEAYRTRNALEIRLQQLKEIEPAQTPSATTPAPAFLSTSYLDHKPTAGELSQRRQYNQANQIRDASTDIAQVAAAIESTEPLDVEQILLFERIIRWEIDALSEELKGKASEVHQQYPNNLSITNHYEYIVLPSLVYELSYPRTDKINWIYVFEKGLATAGVLFIMMLVSQSYIYPVVMQTVEMRDAGMPLLERLKMFPSILSELIFPFMMEYLMAWYIIWECILNLLAELTYFADRGFYADWWNSISWDQFARDWNRPVHNFLLRHVYHSSISSLKINKMAATLITFFLSAVVHELVMWCLFKKLRGYLLVMQMCQLPLVQLSRSRFLKGHETFGNLFFWVGIFTGPSLLCSLYLII